MPNFDRGQQENIQLQTHDDPPGWLFLGILLTLGVLATCGALGLTYLWITHLL